MADQGPWGAISWIDITVDDAEGLKDFYKSVVGWNVSRENMGDYNDFTMLSSDDEPAAGICHARGPNLGLPPMWLIYATVPDLHAALDRCRALGGQVLGEIRGADTVGLMCPIRDPAGACLMLFQPPADSVTS